MPSEITYLANAVIKLAGANISTEMVQNLVSVEVEDSLYLPSMFRIELYDNDLTYASGTEFAIGKAVTVTFSSGGMSPQTGLLIDGEITSIEPMLRYRGTNTIVIRGYDKTHRLHRGKKTAVFQQVSDSDLFSRIAGSAGLTADATTTSVVHEVIFQDNMTDWEFLCTRARRVGHVVRGSAGKVVVKSVAALTSGPALSIELGRDIFEFTPRLTAEAGFNEVTVKGWDVAQKAAIVGTKTSTPRTSAVGSTSGLALGQSAFAAAKWVFTNLPVATQADAEAVAGAAMADADAGDVQAEAVLNGDPRIVAGKYIDISMVGPRFGGKYFVTHALHRLDGDGYRTEVRVAGRSSDTFLSLLTGGAGMRTGTPTERHAAIALVTNNNDDQNLGRVKLKYPWLDDTLESGWVRVATPMTGNGHGFQVLPEVNDEVLVVFEHGDLNHPIVIGSLWNGQDKPPLTSANAVASGKTEQRIFKTRVGHTILLKDKSGEEAIHFIDKSGNNKILIETHNKTITVESEDKIVLKGKNIDITATDAINITGKDITTKANGALKEEATNTVTVKGTGGVTVESAATMALKANGTLDVKGQGPVTVESSAITNVKGSLVKLN